MQIPDFLIIGAMKAGTTTLYRDLSAHPGIYLPEEKEPETLLRFGNDDAAIIRDYKSLLGRAPEGSLTGEASTGYTKRPMNEGVAERARRICGPKLRMIYLTRDPIKRIVSHYMHDIGQGYLDTSFDDAVRHNSRFVDISRYEWQIAPWRECFGDDAILRLRFEEYIRNRAATVRAVCHFLGIDPAATPEPAVQEAFNASNRKPIAASTLSRGFINSRFYQRTLKPSLPKSLRDLGRNLLPTKALAINVEVTPSTRTWLEAQLALDEPFCAAK